MENLLLFLLWLMVGINIGFVFIIFKLMKGIRLRNRSIKVLLAKLDEQKKREISSTSSNRKGIS
ncbi:hypothetical protein [Bacillus taeanensis]|uniref:Uncharacterized protein n=1 Tax=Bacillus taeanensis TaxID=273032 RepID=A0A366XVJ3_9BACI|nr:hypothetical protein [Bacillus taeanensis]RBW68779.1 hypothetical protein DS031_14630 [Bacillus taeanensis]